MRSHRMSGQGAMVEGYGVPPAQGTVRVATSTDVAAVASLHSKAIAEGFLSSLGNRFLVRLYARIVRSPHGFLLVAEREAPTAGTESDAACPGDVVGFVAGSAAVGLLYREFLWRDGLAVAFSSGIKLAQALPKVVETLRHGSRDDPAQTRAGKAHGSAPTETELLAMAVDGRARRHGIGAALVESFIESARATGSESARVVVAAENRAAIALYAGAGFGDPTPFELHSGTPSLVLRATLTRVLP